MTTNDNSVTLPCRACTAWLGPGLGKSGITQNTRGRASDRDSLSFAIDSDAEGRSDAAAGLPRPRRY